MTALFRSRALAEAAVEKLRVFAQPQRLMILSCIRASELPVGLIEQRTGIGQPSLSQQLGELRRAGLVATRRKGKLVFYRLADEGVALCVRTLEAMFGADTRTAAAIESAMAPQPEAPAAARFRKEEPQPASPLIAAVFARIAPGSSVELLG